MTIAKFSKWAIFTALILAGSMGAPLQAQAAGRGGGQDIIVFDIVDSVQEDQSAAGGGVGGDIIVFDIVDSFAEDSSDTEESGFQPDPEYKYVPVRR
jgi:hypothetical protein